MELNTIQSTTHKLSQFTLYHWARLRYSSQLYSVARFCLFVGYPRSGHSIVGAILNAHRNAVIAHELDAAAAIVTGCSKRELYTRILARSTWFNLRRNHGVYPYQIPNQWQGRFDKLTVIGDKRGGAVTRAIADHPELLDRVRALVGVPLRLIPVVRNPFDNIAAISIRHSLSMDDATDYYFRHCDVTGSLSRIIEPTEWITIHHEDLISDPRTIVNQLCGFVGLAADERYLDDCAQVIFSKPSRTRDKVCWAAQQRRDVELRISAYSFLRNYSFE